MGLQELITELETERAHNGVMLQRLLALSDERIAKEEDLKRQLVEEFAERDRALSALITGGGEA